jgi:hydroxyacylglutathione hydrolase
VYPAHASMPPEASHTDAPFLVHTVTDRFSLNNTYLINEERLVIVDPCSTLNVRLLEQYLQQVLQRTPNEIDLIVLTHLHPEHSAGVEALQRLCQAPVAASALVQPILTPTTEKRPPLTIAHLARQAFPGIASPYHFSTPSYFQQSRLVDTWLDDATCLPGHPDWRIIASPGHSLDSLCLYNPITHELLCGDTAVTAEGRAPLIRSGIDRKRLETTLHMLRNLEVDYLYPGHGRAILGKQPLQNAEIGW